MLLGGASKLKQKQEQMQFILKSHNLISAKTDMCGIHILFFFLQKILQLT